MSVYFDQKKQLDNQKKKDREAAEAVAKVFGFFIQPAIVMLLWNWLMPGLFGFATIGYLKAGALYLISRILFGRYE